MTVNKEIHQFMEKKCRPPSAHLASQTGNISSLAALTLQMLVEKFNKISEDVRQTPWIPPSAQPSSQNGSISIPNALTSHIPFWNSGTATWFSITVQQSHLILQTKPTRPPLHLELTWIRVKHDRKQMYMLISKGVAPLGPVTEPLYITSHGENPSIC